MNQNIINKVLINCNKIDEGIKSNDFTLDKVVDFIPLTNEIIQFLFDSVLAGEFISVSTNEQIQKIKRSLDFFADIENILSNNPNIQPSTRSKVNEFKYQIQGIQNILDYYLLFFEDIQIILQNPEKDEIFTLSETKYQSDKDSEILKLFSLNLFLCFFDFLFTEKQTYYQDIVSIKDKLTNLLSNSSLPVLTVQIEKMNKKATFLLFKWCKRAELSGVSLYIDKGIENYEAELKGYGGDWISLVAYINNHYYDEKNPKEKRVCERNLKESFAEIATKDFSKFSCRDIHLYIKYHKDIVKNIDKLDKIIDFLEDWKEEGNISREEKNVRETIYHYAINNRFSLFTGTCKNRKNLRETYERIYNKDNKNYFLQYKFIDKSIELINDELNKNNDAITIAQIEDIENYLAKIKEDYKVYKTNIEWILEHIYFIYRVSFDECVIDEIFIYSSFLLPLDNRKSKDSYERIADSFRELKSQIKPLKRIIQFDEKIEKHDTKTIELMGLFSAIIAFIMGSIPTIQHIKGIYDIGIFFIVFATSLISFLLVLLFITGRIKVNKKTWYLPIIIILFYGAMVMFTFSLSNKNDNSDTSEQQTEKPVTKERNTSGEATNSSPFAKDSLQVN